MIAITGATGRLGRLVVSGLKQRTSTAAIVALARDLTKAKDLGVAARRADYDDSATLDTALAGIDELLLISSNASDRSDAELRRVTEHRNVIAAAKRAGVRHVVYTGILHSERWDLALSRDHRLTEEEIITSGLSFTFLRNAWYWENVTENLAPVLEHGVLAGSAGNAPISWASRRDLADAAVAVLATGGHEGKTYELGGDEASSFADIAAEIARQAHKPVRYENLSEAEHAAYYQRVGLPARLATKLAEVEALALGGGFFFDDSHTLSKLIGRPTTSLRAAVTEGLRS